MTMFHTMVEDSTESNGPDAVVTQLLSQFQSSSSRTAPSGMTCIEQEIQEPPKPEMPQSRPPPALEVVVPTVDNPGDYEYLPGHFAVRRILHIDPHDAKKPVFTVRLQSGERETISRDRFIRLENSKQAMDQFNPASESEDELVMVEGRADYSRRLYSSGDGAASSDDDYSDTRKVRRRRHHHKRAPGRYSSFYQIEESDSESDRAVDVELSSSDELNDPYLTRRRLRRSNREPTRTTSTDESIASIRRQRISKRQRKAFRSNLRERFEDDVSEAESDAPRQQKYAGAREVFHELSRDDEFRQRHFACCATCSYYEDDPVKGPLVFCQGCSSSYHQACLGPRSSREHLVTKIDEDNFILQCRRCLGISHAKSDVCPHLGRCAVCNEEGPMSQPLRERLTSKEEQQLRVANGGTDPVTPVEITRVNNIDNVLFRCARCQRAFHVEHLSPETGQDSSQTSLDHNSQRQCHDCANAPGEIEELVAWRPFKSQVVGSGVLHAEIIPEVDKEFLIKWKQKSYFRATWMPGDWVWGVSNHAMRRAFYNSPKSRKPVMTAEEAISEEKLRVDIVFDVRYSENTSEEADESNPEMVEEAYVKFKGLNYEDSVWENPPKPSETARWEDFKTAFNDWLFRDAIQLPSRNTLKTHLAAIRTQNFERDLLLNTQPELVTGGELMEYQMDGVNWLYYMFVKQQNAILADDMGLGKTIQIIGLFATLIQQHKCWPFLVVAPNSTVPNWRREIKNWTPGIGVVTYFGSAFSRQMANDYEMFPEGGKNLRCHVVIASYESMVDDEAKRVLSRIPWAGLVVDEGQRLKNDKSQLYERLTRMKFDFKVLLTGTPLQNNIRELFNLIQFLDPDKDAEELEEQYGELTAENIRTLHEMIRPFFLRRTKAEVLPFLPPMVQIIVPVSMSVVQKKLYKSILGKNPELIKAICKRKSGQLKKAERHNLNNILVQLRKCLCHPFIYNKDIEEQTHDPVLAHRHLMEASGKLRLLSLMLPKLRERGHRVLIFSQFLENLDIVEDFLSGLGLVYCRLDGKLSARQKQHQIDEFNAPDSPFFAFLLSTRSGGVGINLASADTVIIMDPDFNPKQDMQAFSRAHRIGQKNTVLVFHLTTRGSVEEKIMEKGKRKLALDHVLIERMEADEDEEDLESILRHGAAALFDDDDSADVHYDPGSIDKLLDRSQAEKAEKIASDAHATDQPQFSFARVWQNERGTLEEVTETKDKPMDVTLWEQILRERERDATEEAYRKAEGLGRGKRKRATVNYQTVREEEGNEVDAIVSSPVKTRKPSDSDGEFQQEEEAEESDSVGEPAEDVMDTEAPVILKIRPFRRVLSPPPVRAADTTDGAMDAPPCIACKQRHAIGSCPLKLAGVENCPLCGLAHFGKNRGCPHLHSQVQVRRMLEALSHSNESPELIALAKKHLRGILGDLGQRERRKAEKERHAALVANRPPSAPQTVHRFVQQAPATTSRPSGPNPMTVDLTSPGPRVHQPQPPPFYPHGFGH